MPDSSDNISASTATTQSLPRNASLENLRKQAKTLLKQARLNESDALARIRAFHPRPDSISEVTLSVAQVVIARSYGFASWAKLKQHVEVITKYSSLPAELKAAESSAKLVDRFIALACLNYSNDHSSKRDQARELLIAEPALSRENIFAAATVGDVIVVDKMLRERPGLAQTRGGPYNWEPLLYACYSRLNSKRTEHSTLEVARLLLSNGGDPNAGVLLDRIYLFTALTGVFGEGEMGPTHQPEHQYCYELARLLLEAGADPNDGQTLYNRMFTGGTRHLELLFEFGLGSGGNGVWYQRLGEELDSPAELLQQQVAWAAKYNQMARMKLLIEQGVDLNQPDNRFRRLPYELAVLNGNLDIAELLLSHGARKTVLNDEDAFAAACLNGDADRARTMVANDPTLLDKLGQQRVEFLHRAAESNKSDAVRLMVELGFDLNERKRTAPIHMTAAGGNLRMVKLLIELGADPMIRDEEFNGTALGWADYSGRTEVVEYLKSLGCTY